MLAAQHEGTGNKQHEIYMGNANPTLAYQMKTLLHWLVLGTPGFALGTPSFELGMSVFTLGVGVADVVKALAFVVCIGPVEVRIQGMATKMDVGVTPPQKVAQ